MWLLIFWLSSPFNVSSGDARQPTLAVHSQAFHAYFHERRSLNNFHRDRVITFEQIAE
ncbi:hypothetical protein ACSSQY_004419 [Shigella flexneri]